ncbi:MAG: ribosomal RNA small subunit methyltransferase E [marine bacterium B5-7]|nr:MAG: ribosomal RNA small subunit methyltransferase E [marine bacterium B5-7]
MRVPRLFIDIPLTTGEIIKLPRDKAHHISHVLRMRIGDAIKLINDSGEDYQSKIIEISKKSAQIEIGESIRVTNESPLTINLCLAVARGQHMDFSIQKAVELGVKNIIPVISRFSNVKIEDDRVHNKLAHWQNIIISATEQCGRSHLTQIQKPVSFTEWLNLDASKTRLILHPESQQSMLKINLPTNELTLMIGPEGGFSDDEVEQAQGSGCVPISLGPRILRTETAVVCAVSSAQQLWGDLN